MTTGEDAAQSCRLGSNYRGAGRGGGHWRGRGGERGFRRGTPVPLTDSAGAEANMLRYAALSYSITVYCIVLRHTIVAIYYTRTLRVSFEVHSEATQQGHIASRMRR